MAGVVAYVRDGTEVRRWRLLAHAPIDLDTVDRLARLQLLACRTGGRIEVREATPPLRELLELVGLLGQMGREPKGREQRRVEEVVLPGDLPVDDVEHLERERRVPALGVDPVGTEGRSAVGPGGQEA